MTRKPHQDGFSLTETLMAVGTLAIGLTFIAGAFLTGIYFSTYSTERTIASVAAEEAFAKVQIFGLDPDDADLATGGFVDYNELATMPAEEVLYPSTREAGKQYSWAALCRRTTDGNDLVQVTVFVSRETGGNLSYWKRQSGAANLQLESSDLPRPVRVNVVHDTTAAQNEITIKDAVASDTTDERAFVSSGSILVDDATGQIYRALDRSAEQPDRIELDRDWEGGDLTSAAGGWVWVVPPAASGGKNPSIAVYQKILRFPGR